MHKDYEMSPKQCTAAELGTANMDTLSSDSESTYKEADMASHNLMLENTAKIGPSDTVTNATNPTNGAPNSLSTAWTNTNGTDSKLVTNSKEKYNNTRDIVNKNDSSKTTQMSTKTISNPYFFECKQSIQKINKAK
jgi:hypothetical protein